MRRIEGAAARDEIDGPNAKFVIDKGAHERTRVCRKYVYVVIREPRRPPRRASWHQAQRRRRSRHRYRGRAQGCGGSEGSGHRASSS